VIAHRNPSERSLIWPILFFAIGVITVIAPLITNGHVPGNSGDSRFNLYVLEHFYQSIIGSGRSFIDAPFYYPWPSAIGFSDTHWGTGLIYAGFRAMGWDTTEAFSIWFLIGNMLNFWVCYYVFTKLGLSSMGAAFGAFLYSFCLPVTSQFSHVQLIYREWVPLAILFLNKYLETRNPLHMALMVLMFCLQASATFYIGIFLIVLMLGWTLGWMILKKRQEDASWSELLKKLLPEKYNFGLYLAALLVVLVGCGILVISIWPNLHASKLYGFKRTWDEIKMGLPHLDSYIQASHSNLWWPDHNKLPMTELWWEKNLFPGLIMSLAIFISFLRISWAAKPLVFVCRVALILMLLSTLSFFGCSFYFLLSKAPGFDSVRAICRIILVMIFPGAFIAGAFLEWIPRISNQRWIGGAAVSCVMIFSVYEASNISYQRDMQEIWNGRISSLEGELQRVHQGPYEHSNVLVVTYPEKSKPEWWEFQNEIDAMLLSQKLGIKTLNGYSGNFPPGWKRSCSAEDILDNIAEAQKFRISHALPVAKITPEDLIILGGGRIERETLHKKLEFPELRAGKQFTILNQPGEMKRYFLNNGWGAIEGDKVISRGSQASVIVRVPPSNCRKIWLQLQPYMTPGDYEIDILLNKKIIATTSHKNPSNLKPIEVTLPESLPEYASLNIKIRSSDLSSKIREVWRNKRFGMKSRFAFYGICS